MTQDLRAVAQALLAAWEDDETVHDEGLWNALRDALAAPLSSQDLRAAAQAAVDAWFSTTVFGVEGSITRLRDILAAPSEPDLLPGLKRALEFTSGNDHYRLSKLIARIEKERQS